LAIDIGGSKCLIGLVSETGKIYVENRFVWDSLSREAILERIVREIDVLLKNRPADSFDVVGAAIPGLTNAEKGLWIESSFSGIRDWAIAEALARALGKPCAVDNDANAAALAEACYGGGKGIQDFLYITVSNGIGGAAFCGGKLLRGSGNNVFEIGHCTAVEGGRKCGCGRRGCLEMYASGPALARNYAELGGAPLADGEAAECADIARRAQAGEQAARETFRLEGRYLGFTLATACNLFNPQAVFLGGGVSMAFGLFEDSLKQTIRENLYQKANENLMVCRTGLGYDGALLGAAAVAFRHETGV
jgi:glucokinase